jgi:hypothetical protein
MAFEPSVAVFDACILYPFHLRNIVFQAAVDRLVEARWTGAIHELARANLDKCFTDWRIARARFCIRVNGQRWPIPGFRQGF